MTALVSGSTWVRQVLFHTSAWAGKAPAASYAIAAAMMTFDIAAPIS